MASINGVVIGLVTNVNDPEGLGRVKLRFPWLADEAAGDVHETDWVRIATGMAGNNRGMFFMPEVEDEVLVAFEHGDTRFPFVVGFLWNGKDLPPAENIKMRRIQSVNGHRITFLDAPENQGAKGALVIEDAHGNTISLSNAKMVIECKGELEINGKIIRINGRNVSPVANPI